MVNSDGGVLGGPNGGDERKRSHPYGMDSTGIYSADGVVATSVWEHVQHKV